MAKQKTHLYQRKTGGVWWAWFYDRNNERIRFSTGCVDKQAAAKVLAQRELEEQTASEAGLSTGSAGLTVGDAVYYLAEDANSNALGKTISEETRGMYRTKGGHLDRLLGDIPLVKLTRADVVNYKDTRLTERVSKTEEKYTARTTVKKELVTLATALKIAADKGWVAHGTSAKVMPLFVANSEAKIRWLTHEEFPKLLAALDTSEWFAKRLPRLKDPELAAKLLAEYRRDNVFARQLFVAVGCFAAAELAALEALDWTDVDFTAGTIRVPGTKSGYRDRTVDLDPQLAKMLLQVPESARVGKVLRPWPAAPKDLAAACVRAGIVRITRHTLRHTFGAWMVQAGVSSFVVGRLMGHKDGTMVEKFYGHLAPKTKSDAMAKLPTIAGMPAHNALHYSDELSPVLLPKTCDTGVPKPLVTGGAYGAQTPTRRTPDETVKRGVSVEESLISASKQGEGRRTRTFNQRIKSPMHYH